MGFFDSVKKSLGLAKGEIEVRIQPETLHIGGEVQGQVVLKAEKAINIHAVEVELIHTYPSEHYEYGDDEEVVERMLLASQISLQAGESSDWQFYIPLPPQAAASMAPFGWTLTARAVLQGNSTLEKKQRLQVRLSPIMGTIYDLVTNQFGFQWEEAGADEDGLWLAFRPTGAVRAHFGGLELAFDEQDEALYLWITLDGIRPHVVERFGDRFDRHEGSIEFVIQKSQFASGPQVDRDGLMGLIQPIFAI